MRKMRLARPDRSLINPVNVRIAINIPDMNKLFAGTLLMFR
jgi:hypothetical protein